MIKKLSSDSIIYGLSNIIAKFIGVFTLPIYSTILTTEDYGIIGILITVFSFTFFLLTFSMDSAVMRFYYNNESTRKLSLTTWFVFQLLVTVFFAIVFLVFQESVQPILFGKTINVKVYGWMYVAYILLSIYPAILQLKLRLLQKAWNSFFFSVSIVIINVVSTLLLVAYFKLGAIGFLSGQIIGLLFANIIGVLINAKGIQFAFNKLLFNEMFKYAIPVFFSLLALQLQNIFVARYLELNIGLAEAGLYYMANNIASFILIFTASFAQAFGPMSFDMYAQQKPNAVYARIFHIYILAVSFISSSFCLLMPEIMYFLVNAKFYDSEVVGCLLVFNLTIGSISIFTILGSSFKGKTQTYLIGTIASLVVSLAGMFALSSSLGILGVAISLISGQIVLNIICYWLSSLYIKIPFKMYLSLFWMLLLLVIVTFIIFIEPNAFSFIIIKFSFILGHSLLLLYLLKRYFEIDILLFLRKKFLNRVNE